MTATPASAPVRGAPPARAAGAPSVREAVAILQVDRIRCDGYGLCAELLPELMELDDWGYPVVGAGAVPDALLPLARRAVDACPVLALRVRRAGS